MKTRYALLLALTFGLLHSAATAAPGKTQTFTSPDQVPDGLAKSDWASIRAAYEAGRHSFQPTATGWQARNPGQQWTTQFDRRGFLATPKDGGWTWGLELQSYGFPGAERPISGVPTVKADGQRLTYQWDAAVQEWWVNDKRGLEHGFTVKERPAGSGQRTADSGQEPTLNSQPSTLNFVLATRGSLTPAITEDAKGVLFRDAAGATVLNYTGLKVWDADGKVLSSRFELAASQPSTLDSQPTVRLLVDERGARYPLTIDPIAQQAYVKAGNNGGTTTDQFGQSVAVSGDTVVVGAPNEDSSTTGVNSTPDESASGAGAAYVFVRSAGVWTQQAYLKPAAVGTTQTSDNFGSSVAVSGDTVVVGATGEDSSTTGANSTPDENAALAGAVYIFTGLGPASTVTGITPATGSTAGGTSVTITGTGFTGATGVTIGGVAATSVVVVNATTITCTTPAGSAGTASVIVTTPGGSNAANTLYTYAVPNTAPTVASAIPDFSVPEDAANVVTNLTLHFSDIETPAVSLTYAVVANTNTALVTASITSATNLTLAFAANGNGTSQVSVSATDPGGLSVTNTFVVTVNAVNDTPTVVLAIADFAVNEDAANVVTNLTLHFSDIETPAVSLTYAVVANTNTALVTASITSATNLTLTFAANGNGTSQIAVSATDPSGLSVTNTFVVTVNAVNDAPTVVLAIADFAVNEDTANVVTNLTLHFSDIETPAVSLTYTVTGNTVSALVTATITQGTNLTLAFTANASGSSTLTVRATDGGSLFVEDTFTVTVTSVNDAPTLAAITDPAAILQDAVAQTVNLTGISAGGGESQVLAVTATSSNPGLIANPTVTYTSPEATGSLRYTPVANANGTAVITVTVTDDGGTANGGVNQTTRTFTATVGTLVSARPTNAVPGAQTVFSGATLRFSATNLPNANPIQVGDLDSTVLTVSLLVTNGTVTVSNLTGLSFVDGRTNGSNVVFTGSTSAVNNALESLAYVSKVNYFGDETLHIVTTDEGGRTNRGNGTVSILVEIPTLGGIPKVSLEGLNDRMTGRVITNVTGLVMDRNLVQGITYDSVGNVVNVVPVAGQDGSTNRSTISVRVQFSDGTEQDVVVPVIIYQPLLTSVSGDAAYTSTFGRPIFNPQTSLYEQKVSVVNNTPFDFTALRITATNLAAGVSLRNASITNGGLSYIEYNLPVRSGSNITLTLEYYNANRAGGVTPGLKLELLNSSRVIAPPANPVMSAVLGRRGYAPDGRIRFYIEFPTAVGRTYFVQYKDAVGDPWKTSPVGIPGTGNRLDWLDDGAPNTDSPPGIGRFYRVVTGN